MKKIIWIFNIVAMTSIFLSMWIGVSIAQPLPYSLSGHIYDNESNCIVGADITLLNKRTGDTLKLTSTTDGEYQEDAYNFKSHYKNHDMIWYTVTYGEIGAVEKAKIDISKGGTKLDIILTVKDHPKITPNPTPRKVYITKKSADMYQDTDGDGVSDSKERIRRTNPNDPCDPYPDSAQCILKNTPSTPKIQLTPEVFSPVKVNPTPIPTPVATPKPMPVAVEPMKQIPGFSAVWCIAGLIFVVFLLDRKTKRR